MQKKEKKILPMILGSPTYKISDRYYTESNLSTQLKKKFYNFNFHEKNELFCYNYSSCFKRDGDKSSEYIMKIITKVPINNIMNNIYNNYKFENIVKLKEINIDDFKYLRCIFINNAVFVKCTISPIMRELDKKIKQKMLNNIILERVKEEQDPEFSLYNNKEYLEYFKNYPPLTHNIEEYIRNPLENKFDYEMYLKKFYVYYYCLYKYILKSRILDNDEFINADSSLKYIILYRELNNDDFINFINEEKKNIGTKLDTIEKYIHEINILDPNEQYKRFDFIKNSDNFIYLPDYTFIITINDIINIIMFNYKEEMVEYNSFILIGIYKYNYNINNIFDIGDLIELEKIERGNDTFYEEIMNMLENNKRDIKQYFLEKLNFIEPPIDESVMVLPNLEKITIIDSHIHIWTNVSPINNFFHFNAEYKPDGYNSTFLNWGHKSVMYLPDLMEYLSLGIVNKMDFYIYEKKKNVPFYYYDLNNIKGWFSEDIDDSIRKYFSDFFVEYGESFERYRIKNSIPLDDKRYKITKVFTDRSCKIPKKYNDYKIIIPKVSENDDISDKLNLYNESFVDVSREFIIEEYLKKIKWNGNITRIDCHLQIYGHIYIQEENKFDYYLLYIISKKIKNDDIDKIVNNDMKNIMKDIYIFNSEYLLYLHKIDTSIIRDYTEEMEPLLRYNTLYQLMDNPIRKTIGVIYDEYFKHISNNFTFDIIKGMLEIGENYSSHRIFENKHLEHYKTREYKNFPSFLVDKNISYPDGEYPINSGLFDYIRFLMIMDESDKPKLYNSFESKNLYSETAKSPFKQQDKRFYCPIVFFFSGENMLKNFDMSEMLIKIIENNSKKHDEDITKLRIDEKNIEVLYSELDKEPLLTELIKNMIIDVYRRRNRFILVGYPLPWRNGERIINITSLIDTDIEHLRLLFANSLKCIIDYINSLKIEIEIDGKNIILEINENNIEIMAHYPNANADIHFHFKIYKNAYSNYAYRNINYYEQYNFDYLQLLNLLNLKISFFNRFKFNRSIETTKLIKIMNLESSLESSLKSSLHSNNLSIENTENTENILIKENIKEQIGGNDYDKIEKWTNKYMKFKNIFKNYQVPQISIEFEIVESKKPILNENIYKKYINRKHDIGIHINFLKKFYNEYHLKNFDIHHIIYKKKFIENLLFKKFNNVMNITKYKHINDNNSLEKYDNFYISDDLSQSINYKKEYDKKLYDFININNDIDEIFNKNKMSKFIILYLKKNLISLLWALKHLLPNGCIYIHIREFLRPVSYDLLLLLLQFSSISIMYNYLITPGFENQLYILCYDFKKVDILIKHLEKILTFDLNNENTSFIKITKIIKGDINFFNKMISKISNFIINRITDFIDCFEDYNGNLKEIIEPEIENLIKTKATLLLSQNYSPRPDNLPYITSLLKFKKIKIGNEYIDIEKNITQKEGKLLYKLIKNINATQILEIGMSYGLSSLYILQSLKYFNNKYNKNNDYKLTSIDPVQTSEWNNIGIENLKNAELNEHHKLIEKKSYLALSKLIDNKKSYDIVFINGWLTFDYIAYDIFGSYILLKENGYLIINNITYPGIDKTIKFIEENYKYLKKKNTDIDTIVLYLKLNDNDNDHDI